MSRLPLLDSAMVTKSINLFFLFFFSDVVIIQLLNSISDLLILCLCIYIYMATSSPSGSPSGTSNSPSSGGGGSKSNVPTTDDSTSAGNSTKLSFSVLSFSAQATTAYSKGKLEYAAYLSDQL
ncbi:hypothetical protein J1N35_007462 [Gossypium stocksii]|uniref:Uncharacterized protein n=1 Tax=Gossypium stocksii TaxID=47602 RepID=A0A9D3W645_9ROSI|nr:hypothetical protein J1N35_007462 [Gossypium stocksii]